MKNSMVLLCLGVLLGGGLVYWQTQKTSTEHNEIVIGVLQTISHPALDQAREGFEAQVQKQLGKKVVFLRQNFEGNLANGLLMVQKLENDSRVKGIFAIATPAAQLAVSMGTKKPIIITAVTNPAMLADDGQIPKNLFGTTDMISVDQQVAAIKKFLPTVKRVGIIYNPGEANSLFLRDKMLQAFEKAQLTTLSIGVSSEAEVGSQVNVALGKVDALIAPTDNLIISVAGFVANICTKAGIPFMVSDPPSVVNGPLFAAGGVDYAHSGAVAGELAVQVLSGLTPKEPIINALQAKIVVNRMTMKTLGLKFDPQVVTFIN